MPKVARSTDENVTIQRILRRQKKMQKFFYHAIDTLICSVKRREGRHGESVVLESQEWLVCPVCLARFAHRDSLKGHVRCVLLILTTIF